MTAPDAGTPPDREAGIADATVEVIDRVTRLLASVTRGRWHLAGVQTEQVSRTLDQLAVHLARTDQPALARPVLERVRAGASQYRIGRALYPAPPREPSERDVTPAIARHVVHHYWGEGRHAASRAEHALLLAVIAASLGERALLARIHPGVVAAVGLAERGEAGLDILAAIAARPTTPTSTRDSE